MFDLFVLCMYKMFCNFEWVHLDERPMVVLNEPGVVNDLALHLWGHFIVSHDLLPVHVCVVHDRHAGIAI